jgi:hypothetical protein
MEARGASLPRWRRQRHASPAGASPDGRDWEDAAIEAARRGEHDPWRDPPAVFATLPKGSSVDDETAAAADGI